MVGEWTERSPLRERLEKRAEYVREYNRKYQKANKDSIAERHKVWATKNRKAKAKYLRDYQQANKERLTVYYQDYYLINKKRVKGRQREYYLENKDRILTKHKEYVKKHKDEMREYYRMYAPFRREKRQKSVLSWLTPVQYAQIEVFYATAGAMGRGAFPSIERGQYEIDHIVPIRGERVCGLHVPWNLQILTADENREKNNHLPDNEHLICYAAPGYDGVRRKLLLAARRAA